MDTKTATSNKTPNHSTVNIEKLVMRTQLKGCLGIVITVLTLTAMMGCNRHPEDANSSTGAIPPKNMDAAAISAGEKIYGEYCAKCHGKSAQGDPQWRKVGPDGHYPPPPLNGTGHAWHHSRAVLHEIIKNGSQPGQGNMPGWGNKLSDTQIDSVISYIQSLWSDEVYAAWYAMQQNNK
jgi:mono/diheme cytochrome c family protein